MRGPDYSTMFPTPEVAPMPEMRISPDRMAVAMRTDNPADAWNAWAYIHKVTGGGFLSAADVADWNPLTVSETAAEAP